MVKRKLWLIIIVIILMLSILFALSRQLLFRSPESVALVNCPTNVSCTGFHPGNNRQNASTVWLGCYDGKLYYFNKNISNSLYALRRDAFAKVSNLSHGTGDITILGIVNNFIYYRERDNNDYMNQKLYCYDLDSNQEVLLYSGHLLPCGANYFCDEGAVYFPLLSTQEGATQFVHALGQNMLGIKPLTEGYTIGTSVYIVEPDVQVERISETDLFGNILCEEVPFEQAYKRSIIPYESGLLVHNEGLNSLLYQIGEEGNVTELFNVPCLSSVSSVNIHNTDAYISVLRYEKYGEKGMLRYENDQLEGIYRISLIDGSVEKINDMCFAGIYNFDDTCFYCCDNEGNVYVMGFDGTVCPILKIAGDGLR